MIRTQGIGAARMFLMSIPNPQEQPWMARSIRIGDRRLNSSVKIQAHNRVTLPPVGPGRRNRSVLGFTLIELMIVMSIVLILIGIAAIRYDKVVQHSKEAVL